MLSQLDVGWFLGAYPNFRVNKNAESAEDEFERLAVSRMWKINGKRYIQAKKAFDARLAGVSSNKNAIDLTDELADELEKLVFDDGLSIASSSTSCSDSGVLLLPPTPVQLPTTPATPQPEPSPSSSEGEGNDCPGASLLHQPKTRNPTELAYFRSFPDFNADRAKPLATEFNRLAKMLGWSKTSHEYRIQRTECYKQQFEQDFGIAKNNLQAWQQLCHDLQIKEQPTSVKQCKKLLNHVYVNIYDFIECKYACRAICPVFRSAQSFAAHTKTGSGKFPKLAAKQNPYLQVLLKGMH